MTSQPSGLVDALQAYVDEGLRAVALYDQEGYSIEYLREDLEGRLSPEEIDRIHSSLIIEGIGKDHLEHLFQAGDLECAMYRMEEAMFMHFVRPEYEGLFVAIDADADVPIGEFVATCKEWVG